MAVQWTLTVGGTTKTLSAWGLSNCTRHRVAQGVDTFTARQVVADWDQASPFTYGAAVTIQRNGVAWFSGKVNSLQRAAPDASQTHQLEIVGPGWDLANQVYCQTWRAWDGSGDTYDFVGRAFLGYDGTQHITTGTQVQNIIQWAITRGATLQLGTVDAGMRVPVDEVRDITCAEAIRRTLRLHPDWVWWCDYSTTPPTFHARARSSLTARTITLGTDVVTVGAIVAREDLVVPSVAIIFERADAETGKRQFIRQVAPVSADGLELGALRGTVALEGPLGGGARVSLTTEPIAAAAADAATQRTWWKRWVPALADPKITGLVIANVAVNGVAAASATYLPNALVSGQISGALLREYSGEYQLWTADVACIYDGNSVKSVRVQAEVTGTDAESGEFTDGSGDEQGESLSEFSGLAQSLYDALSVVHYEGTLTLTHQDLPADTEATAIGVGHRLHLAGTGIAAHATMGALVQQVTEVIDTGKVTVQFGPPQHLSLQDLVELLRAFRQRYRETPLSAIISGTISATAPPELGDLFGGANSSTGLPTFDKVQMATGAGGSAKTVTVDPAALAAGETAEFREIQVCVDGVAKKIKVLATAPYT